MTDDMRDLLLEFAKLTGLDMCSLVTLVHGIIFEPRECNKTEIH